MTETVLTWLNNGVLHWSWTAIAVYTLVTTHITVLAVTLYLHRSSAHRALDLHPALQHFFRAWLWLATGMNTKEWTAVHRKHHARCETEDDPHSPVIQGINEILWRQTEAYQAAAADPEVLEQYGVGTPEDWVERHLYTPHGYLGILLMFLIDLTLFGLLGITVWAIQMIWIPLLGGVINGVGHWRGYRNFECPDAARNIMPWGVLIGGEELHNNHHTYPNSAKFSVRKWEFDLGWLWIRGFMLLGLARPISVGPVIDKQVDKGAFDLESATALINDRFNVMAKFARSVVAPVVAEHAGASRSTKRLFKRGERVICRETSILDDAGRARLEHLLETPQLKAVYDLRLKLQSIWEKRTGDLHEVVNALKEWCAEAEATGIEQVHDFIEELKSYALPPRSVV